MAVLSEAERREVETLAKALVVLEADRVCVSPIAERQRQQMSTRARGRG